jgi:hypothetical protein
MKYLFVMLGVVGVLLSGALTAQADEPANTAAAPVFTAADLAKMAKELATVGLPDPPVAPGNAQTAVACTQCFTCGGDWPLFEGAWSVANSSVTERGAACSGVPGTQTTDSRPFLCCR